MKIIGAIIGGLVLVGVGSYFFIQRPSGDAAPVEEQPKVMEDGTLDDVEALKDAKETVLGKSVEGRDVTAYHFGAPLGTSTRELLFVGGTHGGYSWNTALVAYELIDHLTASSSTIPKDVRVTVVPVLNPDGLIKVTGSAGRFEAADVSKSSATRESGRFNGNKVDLNRNFDCKWQADATWQKKAVSGGTAAFSEPEAAGLKAYVDAHKPAAAVVWYSSAGGVFASKCDGDILPDTRKIMNTYAKASGYKANDNYDFYEVTGDMVNWFASDGIPGISVLLTTHESMEWDKNMKGADALIKSFAPAQ